MIVPESQRVILIYTDHGCRLDRKWALHRTRNAGLRANIEFRRGKEKLQRKTHGLRLRMKRDVVPCIEWHSVFRRSSNDRNHKSPQAQKTPVLRPKRWNLAEKRPASWRSYESCSLARFRSENCSFLSNSDVTGGTHRSGIPLF